MNLKENDEWLIELCSLFTVIKGHAGRYRDRIAWALSEPRNPDEWPLILISTMDLMSYNGYYYHFVGRSWVASTHHTNSGFSRIRIRGDRDAAHDFLVTFRLKFS